MLVEGNQNGNMYMATIDNQLTKKEVVITAIFILLVFILIGLIMITKNSINIISEYKIYKQYETQLAVLQKQEEERLAEIEKTKQEKMPKLTQERKKQYTKYLSCRNQKSILNV